MPEWSWTFHPHLEVWALALALEGGYLWALRRIGPLKAPPGERPASGRQVLAFTLGVATLLVAAGWPIHDLAEGSLYSVHMLQHLLYVFVAPPLFFVGTPAWMLRWLLGRRLMRVARQVTRPFIAFVIFNVVLVAIHWPVLVEVSVRSELGHLAQHAALLLASLVVWSPVLNPLIELPHLSYPGRMLYLFLQSIVPTVPASFLTFASSPIYRVYETLPRAFGLDVLNDQRIAGLLMKLGGGFILWGFIAVLFFKWFAREEREGVDEIQWHSIERTLNRTELGGR
ncbi:MAG: cytochrome c oxidase assembly protein [Actinobacteria bacterium]|nr:cytochrome c oxidase assembly protein [Actinomycetota bacterium]